MGVRHPGDCWNALGVLGRSVGPCAVELPAPDLVLAFCNGLPGVRVDVRLVVELC